MFLKAAMVQPPRVMGAVLKELLVGDESRCLRNSGFRAFSGFEISGGGLKVYLEHIGYRA